MPGYFSKAFWKKLTKFYNVYNVYLKCSAKWKYKFSIYIVQFFKVPKDTIKKSSHFKYLQKLFLFTLLSQK